MHKRFKFGSLGMVWLAFSRRIFSPVAVCLVVAGPMAAVPMAKGQENTRNGAVLGGLTGAVVGGVVGHNHKDQTAEGALIGGAVGAVAGGLIGNQRDRYERQRQAYERQAYERQRQQYYQQQTQAYPYGYIGQPTVVVGTPTVIPRGVPQRPVSPKRPVTFDEVIQMVRSGVSDNVIVAQLQTNGVVTRPDVNEVIRLSQEGVSEHVITAIQTVDVLPMSRPPVGPAFPQSSRMQATRPLPSPSGVPSGVGGNGAWNTAPRFAPPPLLERRGY
jgi:outer membrane lipoprotein SlyB